MAAPVPHRTSTNIQQYHGSFPPPVYYRQVVCKPVDVILVIEILLDFSQQMNAASANPSPQTIQMSLEPQSRQVNLDLKKNGTRLLVRTTMNIYHPIYNNNRMHGSQYTDATGSYHVSFLQDVD